MALKLYLYTLLKIQSSPHRFLCLTLKWICGPRTTSNVCFYDDWFLFKVFFTKCSLGSVRTPKPSSVTIFSISILEVKGLFIQIQAVSPLQKGTKIVPQRALFSNHQILGHLFGTLSRKYSHLYIDSFVEKVALRL